MSIRSSGRLNCVAAAFLQPSSLTVAERAADGCGRLHAEGAYHGRGFECAFGCEADNARRQRKAFCNAGARRQGRRRVEARIEPEALLRASPPIRLENSIEGGHAEREGLGGQDGRRAREARSVHEVAGFPDSVTERLFGFSSRFGEFALK